MKQFLLAIVLFLTSGFALADTMVAKSPDGSVTVTLMQEPCSDKVSGQMLLDNGLDEGFKAVVVYKGKVLNACWTVDDVRAPGEVLIADESGDAGMLPQTAFKLEHQI